LLGTPYFVEHGASQYADVPLSFFILATLALLAYQDRVWPQTPGLSALAGITAGMAAWTKNEGLLLVLAVMLANGVIQLWKRRCSMLVRQARFFAAGLIPVLAVVVVFKRTLATPNFFLHQQTGATLFERLTDPDRSRALAQALVTHGWNFGGLSASAFLFVAFYVVCVGLPCKEQRAAVQTSAWTLAMMLGGYCIVSLISPASMTWQTSTSLDRLLLQLWPGVLFTSFLAARTPEVIICCAARRGRDSVALSRSSAES
jgi:hypothetical protein